MEIYLVIPLATQCATERKDGQDRKKTDVKMEEKKGLNKRAEKQELNKGQDGRKEQRRQHRREKRGALSV